MQKSTSRQELEDTIHKAHKDTLDTATRMVEEELGGDFNAMDEAFVERMQAAIQEKWNVYRESYRDLEELDVDEGGLSMRAYANHIDRIAGYMGL